MYFTCPGLAQVAREFVQRGAGRHYVIDDCKAQPGEIFVAHEGAADVARAFAVLGWPNAGESARTLGLALRSLRRTDSRVRSRVRRSGAAAWYALAPSEVAA